MNLRPFLASALALAAFPSLTACDAQTDPSYGGEPLATVRGTITSELDDPPELVASLVWEVWTTQGDSAASAQVPVTGSFPAAFTMELLAPPADDMLNPSLGPDEPYVGTAYITALPPVPVEPLGDEDLLGISPDHVLVYVSSDIQPGSQWDAFLHGALATGYHLMVVHRPNAAEQQEIDACRQEAELACDACGGGCAECDNLHCDDEFRGLFPAPGGFADPVTVHIAAPDQLEVPDFH